MSQRVLFLLAIGVSLIALIPEALASAPRDRRFSTLEDLFGETGETFQAAVAIVNVESDSNTAPVGGFGLSIDDMVVQWREVSTQLDATDCATGQCAVLDVQAGSTFGGNTILDVTLIEASPYGRRCALRACGAAPDTLCTTDADCPTGTCGINRACFADADCDNSGSGGADEGTCLPATNDCDGDGDYFGPDDDRDCDNDTIDDIAIECFTETENSPGERVVLNRETSQIFRGSLPTSVTYDVPGVLFGAQQGNDLPTVTCRYADIDDGTGASVCANSVVPEAQGLVEVDTAIIVDTGQVLIRRFSIADNGDDDGFADERETVTLSIEVVNVTDEPLTNVAARLAPLNGDPDVDCVLDTFVLVGDLAPQESKFVSDDSFVLRIVDDVRLPPASGGDDDTRAELSITLDSDQFAASVTPTVVTLDLDLDASGGGTPSTFAESFEVGALGSFTTMHLDLGLGNFGDPDFSEAFMASDGYRCQYHDPDWLVSVAFGVIQDCFLNPTNVTDEFFWQTTTDRAFTGQRSLHFGIELGPANFTTPFAKLSAVRSQDPINLGYDRVCSTTRLQTCASDGDCPGGESCVFAAPRLTFHHQVSFMNSRAVSAPANESADVGVVQVQSAGLDGEPNDVWRRVESVINAYDEQHTDNFFNCTFDPIDDGNTEDDFFDPTDPNRRTGPSSTCIPNFSWVEIGSTAGAFDAFDLGNAEGPGFPGSTGDGTWIEADVDLQQFRGKRIRLRFLQSSLKAGGLRTWEQAFNFNPDPSDDGWFIDAINVSDTITSPATIGEDLDSPILPGCGATCNIVTADLTAAPATLAAPGNVVELDGVNSLADRCLGGVLQFRYWIDLNGNGVADPGSDRLLRDFTAEPTYVDAPARTTDYVVEVRCSAEPACADQTSLRVTVDCPSSVAFDPLGGLVVADAGETFRWPLSVASVPRARGLLSVLDSNYAAIGNDTVSGTTFSAAADVAPAGDGLWYLLKAEGRFCNQLSWTSAGEGEQLTPGRDAALP